MKNSHTPLLMGIGNIYLETNYLNLETAGKDLLIIDKEYRAQTYETRLGGSVANCIGHVRQLGINAGIFGKIGNDDAGHRLVRLIEENGISSEHIVRSDSVATSVATGIILSHSGQSIQFVAGNANQALTLEDFDADRHLPDGVKAVYLGGFLKQEGLYRDYPELLRLLKSRGILTFLDHGRIPVDVTDEKISVLHESLKHMDVYMPNAEEIMGITGAISRDGAIESVLAMGVKCVAVKLGAQGCRVKTADLDMQLPGYSVNVINTVGAGDAFNAGFITQYLKGNDLAECLAFANATAAIRVSENRNPTLPEVEQFLNVHTE